jgi:hypothetical protein
LFILSSVYCIINPTRLAVLGISCLLSPELCYARWICKAVLDRPVSQDRPYCKPVHSSALHLSNTPFTLISLVKKQTLQWLSCAVGDRWNRSSIPGRGRSFPSSTAFTSDLGATHPHRERLPRVI